MNTYKTTTATKQDLDLSQVVEDMFMVLLDKEREVIVKRFSLDGQGRETLEKIGQRFSVTRERIRQIENAALNKLRRTVDNTRLQSIIDLALELLEKHGGLMLEKDLINEILKQTNNSNENGSIIRLALSIGEDIIKVKKSNVFKTAWRLDEVRERSIKETCTAILKFMETKTDVLAPDEVVRAVQKTLSRRESAAFIKSCLTIHKMFKAVEGGKWGLMTWRHINPKSIRDKAYIILKKTGDPLHFVEIANKITEFDFDKKVVTVQAVHNELIRGEQFVLVGRGLYALKEWGYEPGTVGEVIERILKKAGKPLSKTEIVEKVLSERNVKIGTIALNLQKNAHFVRVGRAVYEYKK